MIFSTQALTTLLFGGSLLVAGSGVHGLETDDHATLVREQLERRLEGVFAAKEEEEQPRNNLLREPSHRELGKNDMMSDFNHDYSAFEGEWFDCLHTKLMTFDGAPAEKHMINSEECDGGLFGTVKSLSLDGMAAQTLQMDVMLLNHCFMHGMGDEFSKPCPDDRIDSDSRGDGNVKVIYSMIGIGSFAGKGDSIQFVSDHTMVHDEEDGDLMHDGEMYSMDLTRAAMENKDTMTCTLYGPEDGIVCDWRINEVRLATEVHAGCVKKNKCKKDWSENKCANKGGTWEEVCEVKRKKNGFGYDSFGSYYVVHDRTKCTQASTADTTGEMCPNVDRPDPADNCNEDEPCEPTVSPAPTPTPVPGCYRGGRCGDGAHGCCDCDITSAEECAASGFYDDGEAWQDTPIWTQNCNGICKSFE